MCACVCNQAPAAWNDLNTMVHHRIYPDGRHLQGHMRCGPNGFLEVVIEGETITTDVPNLMQIHSRPLLKRPAAAESIGSPKKVKLKPAAAEGAPDITVHRKPAAEAAPAEEAAQAAEAEAAPAEEAAQAAALQAAGAAPAEEAAQAAGAEAAPEVEAAQAAALQEIGRAHV